jgi:proline dehydrogenase
MAGRQMIRQIKEWIWRMWLIAAPRAAQSYVAGLDVKDAMLTGHWLAENGFACTIAFWNSAGDPVEEVMTAYRSASVALRSEGVDGYLSVKAPAVEYRSDLLADLVRDSATRIHFDAHGPETADPTFALIDGLPRGAAPIGCTLPGRWARSPGDADWAVDRGLAVRIVKGQWSDPRAPDLDMRQGFLAIVDRLAGRAPMVAVATHDVPLAREALRRLLAAGTPCELELLFGLPILPTLPVAQETGVLVRQYVPYGHGYLPYCISQGVRNPHVLWWALRDSLLGRTLHRPRHYRLRRRRPSGASRDVSRP